MGDTGWSLVTSEHAVFPIHSSMQLISHLFFPVLLVDKVLSTLSGSMDFRDMDP